MLRIDPLATPAWPTMTYFRRPPKSGLCGGNRAPPAPQWDVTPAQRRHGGAHQKPALVGQRSPTQQVTSVAGDSKVQPEKQVNAHVQNLFEIQIHRVCVTPCEYYEGSLRHPAEDLLTMPPTIAENERDHLDRLSTTASVSSPTPSGGPAWQRHDFRSAARQPAGLRRATLITSLPLLPSARRPSGHAPARPGVCGRAQPPDRTARLGAGAAG